MSDAQNPTITYQQATDKGSKEEMTKGIERERQIYKNQYCPIEKNLALIWTLRDKISIVATVFRCAPDTDCKYVEKN